MRRSLLKGLQKSSHLNKLLSTHISNNISTLDNNFLNEIPKQNIASSWATLISNIAQGGPSNTELAYYEVSKMLSYGAKPDGYALVHLVRISVELGLDTYCLLLHGYVVKSGFGSNVFVCNALMRFYRIIESMGDAHKIFVEIPQLNVVSWNSLISGCMHSGKFRKGLGLFLELERSDVCSNAYSFTLALSACGQLDMLQLGSSVHCKTVKYGLDCGIIVANCLIDMYGKCASLHEAVCVFDEMPNRDTISWNSVIAASARNGSLEEAFNFFHHMPNPNTISYNELINGIAQFGNIEDAIKILSDMPNPNSSSWNSIITGYVNRDQPCQALEIFSEMHSSSVKMDENTYSVLLSGVAALAALRWGMVIHCCTTKYGLDTSVVVGSALIDMYSKCGQVESAESIFQWLPKKNLVTWNAMSSGYANNGNPLLVIQLFEQLKMVKDLKPDWITFLNVITACSNSEVSLQNAIQYFESMINDYGIKPTIEHCCSMIRLMGQRGEVWQAKRMINELGFGSYGVVWRALLGASGTCRNLKVATIAAAKVIELEGDDDYVYVMMSNIFACCGKWEDVSKARKLMTERGVRKETGSSWIEVKNAP